MNILVYDINNINDKENICISDEIICPICKENILINIKDYKMNLFDCKYKHNIKNIFIKDYKNTQNIDISKIICNKCKIANKSNTYNNELYICINCNMNLCPLCKLKHEREHKIINYDLKNYICYKHNENYIKYCNECKLNICTECENEHRSHNIIYFGEILSEDNNDNELKEHIDLLKN